jgi:outer membrane protein OmpA-like peptidoglycan-associated protein
VAGRVVDLVWTAGEAGYQVRVRVEGQADPTGTAEFNLALSRTRAQAVVDHLLARGVPGEVLEPVGRGSVVGAEVEGGGRGSQLEALRRVSFTVAVGAPARAESPTTGGG